MSGARDDRTGYRALLDYIRPGDTIVVTALDRLARSLTSIVNTVSDLGKRGIYVRTLRESIDTSTSVGRMLAGLFASLAEYERELIAERAKVARPATEAPGRQGGPGPTHAHRRRIRAHHRPGPGRVPGHALPGAGEGLGVTPPGARERWGNRPPRPPSFRQETRADGQTAVSHVQSRLRPGVRWAALPLSSSVATSAGACASASLRRASRITAPADTPPAPPQARRK